MEKEARERNSGERMKGLFRQTEFHLLLFCLSAFLFVWPFLTRPDMWSPAVMFVYLFLVWGIIIVILFLFSRS